MTTSILNAANNGTSQQWTVGAGTRPGLINSDDGDTTHVFSQNINNNELYECSLLPVPVGIIQRVQQYVKVARAGGGSHSIFLRMYDVTGASGTTEFQQTVSSGTYTEFSKDWIADRPGGGVWGNLDFYTVKFQMALRGGQADPDRIKWSFGKVELDWTGRGGVSKWLIQCWIPPLIGFASHGVITRELVAFYQGFRHRPNMREEFEAIRTALLVRPSFAL